MTDIKHVKADQEKAPQLFLDRCSICGKTAKKKCGGCSLVFYCSPQHQKADWFRHKPDCRPYEIQDVGVGRCLVASRYIPADTTIIAEYPIAVFELGDDDGQDLQKLLSIAESSLHTCSACDIGKLSPTNPYRCSKCGVPLCSIKCESLPSHFEKHCQVLQKMGKKEIRPPTDLSDISRDLILLRIIQSEKRKGKLISYRNPKWGPLLKLMLTDKTQIATEGSSDNPALSKQLLSSLKYPDTYPLSMAAIGKTDTEILALLNCTLKQYSIPLSTKKKRALYEKYGFLSHSCSPNSESWIDDNRFYNKLLVRVIKPIVPGECITINRSDPTLLCTPTLERRQRLIKELSLTCNCERCIDPREKETCLSGIRCTICKDSLTCNYLFPLNPLDKRTGWVCSGKNCSATKPFEQTIIVVIKAAKELESIPSQQGNPAETTITKLQEYIVKHQRKVLHPQHYLILMARSRINKIVSYFLGSGEKLFLCVISELPRSYDYCSYKVDYLSAYLGFLMKLYDAHNEKTIGKIRYELGLAESALLFQDFQHERLAGTTFFKRLHNSIDSFNKCREALAPYSDCVQLMEDAKKFSQMLRRLFGNDFLSSYRLKFMETSDPALRQTVNDAISKWKKSCEAVDLLKVYTNPESNYDRGGGSGSNTKITKTDLQNILMDICDELDN